MFESLRLKPLCIVIAASFCISLSFHCAAADASITGTFYGPSSGTSIHNDGTVTGGKPSPDVSKPLTGTLKASFIQNGNDLAIDSLFEAEGLKIGVTFIGKVGGLAFWGTGTHMTTPGLVENVFICGHFTGKADKLTGKIFSYKNNDFTTLSFSISRSTGAGRVLTNDPVAFEDEARSTQNDPPFTASGSSKGKMFLLSPRTKAADFKSLLYASFVPAKKSAGITFKTKTEELGFNVTEFDSEKNMVLSGSNGSESVIAFGSTKKNASAGTGWIFGATRLVEFKFSIRKK